MATSRYASQPIRSRSQLGFGIERIHAHGRSPSDHIDDSTGKLIGLAHRRHTGLLLDLKGRHMCGLARHIDVLILLAAALKLR